MRRILYVEDDPINALIMQKLLRSEYDVQLATNGKACLRMVREQAFELILMDINLGRGEMNGVEVMQRLKVDFKTLPVIAVTAYAMPEDETRFLELGFDGYVVKPIDRKLILEYINGFFH